MVGVVIEVTLGEPGRWTASSGGDVVGWLRALVRPDQRCALYLRDIADERAYAPLLDAALGELTGELYVEADEDATSLRTLLAERGFAEHRREHHYLVPTGRSGSRALPDGFRLLSAADADVARLSALDDALRQDVPGADGWHNDPREFAAQTFGDPEFDPAMYVVAVHQPTGDYAGLVRVWRRPVVSRLGLIAVLPAHRRRGLAGALLAAAFAVCQERGQAEVTCEVDVTNTASNSLLGGLGARRVGGTVELLRAGS